jgi:hypothetical protein
MHTDNQWINTSFRVIQSLSEAINFESSAVFLSKSGIITTLPTGCPEKRFVWLTLELPEKGSIKALAEVIDRQNSTVNRIQMKFKHLYPKEKMELDKFVDSLSKS